MIELDALGHAVFSLVLLETSADSQRDVKTLSSHVLPSYSVPAPDLHVSVCELPLGVSQLSLSGFKALLHRLHLPLHLLLVLSDGHFQLAQLRATARGGKQRKFEKHKKMRRVTAAKHILQKKKPNILFVCVGVCCTRFALCWSSPCLSFSALSMSKTS